MSEDSPGTVDILIKAAGVPIDRYSGEMVEQLKDIGARWEALRKIRDSVAFAKDKDPAMSYVVKAPKAEVYVIDVSFQALKDKSERAYLNQLPTSFVLSDEAVDRLRAAATTIILNSPDFQRLLKDEGARIVDRPATGTTVPSAAVTVPTAATAAASSRAARSHRSTSKAAPPTGRGSCSRRHNWRRWRHDRRHLIATACAEHPLLNFLRRWHTGTLASELCFT